MIGGRRTCRSVAAFLLDYVEGNLPEATAETFEAHVRMCPNCERYLDQYKETVRLLKDLPVPEPPAELADMTSAFLKRSLGLAESDT